MRVLVTGNLGYLGTVMVADLIERGHEVTGLDSGLFAEQILGPVAPDPATLAVDLRDVSPSDLDGFEAVIHLAALSNDPLGSLDPQLTYDINHHASTRLARAAKAAGVSRFLYASTCSVYGESGAELVNESASLAPLTPYAESKVNVEAELHDLAGDGFSPVSLRNATAFGFSPRLRADIVLNNLVGYAVLTGEIVVKSDGTPWRPLVHARDIATAFAEALVAPVDAIHDKALNVGDESNNLTVAEIAELVAQAVPEASIKITGEFGGDPRSYRVDFSALREALPKYRNQWSVADGAAELADAYRRYGLTLEQFNGSFVRLAALQRQLTAGTLNPQLRPVL